MTRDENAAPAGSLPGETASGDTTRGGTTTGDTQPTCRREARAALAYRERLEALSETIVRDCSTPECHTHIGFEPIPSRQAVTEIIDRLRELLFPGFFSRVPVDPINFRYAIGQVATSLFDLLSEQISRSIRHECFRLQLECSYCEERGYEAALEVLANIPRIRRVLASDIRATFDGDPAAKTTDEIVYSYPGLQAIAVYRVAHLLFRLDVPMLPRMMTEHMHGITGIDIHPGAEIGEGFVIDHGTGVVIGETTQVGDGVRIYQGVTLGALSLPKGAGDQYRGKKRHPTIEDDVIIYSGATILGGDTVVGARSLIGGNVWLTESVPPDTRVMIENPRLIKRSRNAQPPPDPRRS
ncbi:MAG: serine acetyltransferase [Actinomycetia bacterium]|nr:serine acetyltransferase [Actinomycetes bacterium]